LDEHSYNFVPSCAVIRRKPTGLTPMPPTLTLKEQLTLRLAGPPKILTKAQRSHKKAKVVRQPRTKDPPVTWEAAPGYQKNRGAIFAAKCASWIESFCYIRPKRGPLVRIVFNAIQSILMQFVAWRWAHGLPAKVITPKARQLGSSTFWECLLYALCELVPGYHAMVVVHDDEGLGQLMGKVQTLKNALPRTAYGASRLKNDQEGELRWAPPKESAFFSGLIRSGDALGKGGTPSGVHFSEAANYADKGFGPQAEQAIASLLGATASSEWLLEVWESTGKGKDPIFWRRCERARDPNSASDQTLIFLPWLLDEGYQLSWEEFRKRMRYSGKKDPGATFQITPEEKILRDRLANTKVLPEEATYRYQHYLTDEQLIWRRFKVATDCGENLETFKRYFPTFYEECFTATIDSAFPAASIQHYSDHGKPPILRGYLRPVTGARSGLDVAADPIGPLHVWVMPQAHRSYIIGADVGGSLERSDPSCAYVMDRHSLEVVAMVHGHMEWDEFARLLYDLGLYYNKAHLIVENNYQPSVANLLHSKAYPNLHYYFPEDTIEASVGKTPGFNTNRKTRREWVASVRAHLRERSVTNPDPDFWKEMETFVWCPMKTTDKPDMEGDYRGMGGNHDDRIVALALCLTQVDLPTEIRAEASEAAWDEPQDHQPLMGEAPPPTTTSRIQQFIQEHLKKKPKKAKTALL
jgi:hypothetical protein